ncbi:hypothetical protein [Cohnella candidum]|uniref:Uncharacterized protein n=1 Tax=Cohnella candidum TaxID=2674991 RepID=A0A3G3JWX4_9BACL|nr:hypothetical protein [Cohnella candidum]AYQ72742.1 hypothetical protein EAV92_09305 [Cohnella candidum]
MPPVYTAFFLWVASAILWWSGWREQAEDRIPDAAVAVFLAGWPFAAWAAIPAGGPWTISGTFAWAALAALFLAWRLEPSERWTAFAAGFLTGSFKLLISVSPWMSTHLSDEGVGWTAAVLAGASTCALVRGATGQILAVTLALAVHEIWRAAWLHGQVRFEIGSGHWMEAWWVAVLTARSLSAIGRLVALDFRKYAWRRGGEGS